MKYFCRYDILVASFFLGFLSVSMAETKFEKALFAGGCFWCMESPFDKVEGVISTTAGYTGGSKENPTYEEVTSGKTGHVEAMQILYDPKKVSYERLLDIFWHQIDPTDAGGQFADRGNQYHTAIFYLNDKQKESALRSKEVLQKSGHFHKPVVTEIKPAGVFYPAEEYHQDYYKKNPVRYNVYRFGSGRDQYLKKVWGKNMHKPSKEELKKKLTPLQYEVTQEEGTEPPFKNEYWNNKEAGVYVDVISGEPLFSSLDKYDSGTGWPSFTKPLVPENIVTQPDKSLFQQRTEVRSKHGDSHLGHVFEDGPPPAGNRYCINSASLRFIPAEKLAEEGYEEFLKLFGEEAPSKKGNN